MSKYTQEELEESLRAISSLTSKCEKVHAKQTEGTSQHTLMKRRLKAFYISSDLIKMEMGADENG